jgi:signal transduction histidine kinase
MRSISVKITLVLIVVSLIGAVFTAFFVQNRTQTAFDQFIHDQDQGVLVDRLTEHYLENGSWVDANRVFQEVFPFTKHNPGDGNPGNQPNMPAPFFLASPEGIVLTGVPGAGGPKPGNQIPIPELKNGIPLEVNGVIAGWLLPVQMQRPRNNNQQAFLGTVQQGLIISALVTLLIALALGGFLIQSFTRPIRKLASATEKVAAGELGYQVDHQSRDELGKLAASFNSMSADLEKSDRARKQMTADIAHDLRTPLTILQGYTEVLSDGKMEGTPEIYQTMHQQAQHLSYLINDLKTLSLLDSGELNLQIQNIDPIPLLEQVNAAYQPLAAEKQVQVISDLQPALPRVDLDPDRLTQILGNLINNALEVLSPGGNLRISAFTAENQLVLQVEDDGPGISETDLPQIFNRSFRADRSRSGNGSSGLGLSITQKLVESQGGAIEVDSVLGKGTTFTVRFPAG